MSRTAGTSSLSHRSLLAPICVCLGLQSLVSCRTHHKQFGTCGPIAATTCVRSFGLEHIQDLSYLEIQRDAVVVTSRIYTLQLAEKCTVTQWPWPQQDHCILAMYMRLPSQLPSSLTA